MTKKKAEKLQAVNIRLSPKMKFALELAARKAEKSQAAIVVESVLERLQSDLGNPAVKAIEFALSPDCECGMEFLNCWLHGDFDQIRKEWPNAPEVVFVGAYPTLETNDE